MKKLAFAVCGVLLIGGSAWVVAQESFPANKSAAPAKIAQHYSYAIGIDMGTSFRSSQTELDLESLMAGVRDGLSGGKRKLDEQTCEAALMHLQTEMRRKARTRQQADGVEFLAKNRTQPGVQVTTSGLQYKVIRAAKGLKPTLRDTVRCNYRGTLIDGTQFDASDHGPIEFPVSGVIRGWTEALQLMSVGEKWQLFIPADLAYGDQQKGRLIRPGSVLIFDIELVAIVGR